MPVTSEWLPFESLDEVALIEKAVGESRRFVKGLRLNLSIDKPISSITLKDTGSSATAVYLGRNAGDNEDADRELAQLMQMSGLAHVVWTPGTELKAALPYSMPPIQG